MSTKTKKILFITLFSIDMALTLSLFIISIIMIATMPEPNSLGYVTFESGFIGYLQGHPTIFLCSIVLPLFLLLGLNIAGLFIYVKKTKSQKKNVALEDLSPEALKALQEELAASINKEADNKDTTSETKSN